jgi:hypothetical protein
MSVASICMSCGRTDLPVQSVGAVDAWYAACDKCLDKYGRRSLRREADREFDKAYWRAQARIKRGGVAKAMTDRPEGTCWHCPNPVARDANGNFPLWCSTCERERANLETA